MKTGGKSNRMSMAIVVTFRFVLMGVVTTFPLKLRLGNWSWPKRGGGRQGCGQKPYHNHR